MLLPTCFCISQIAAALAASEAIWSFGWRCIRYGLLPDGLRHGVDLILHFTKDRMLSTAATVSVAFGVTSPFMPDGYRPLCGRSCSVFKRIHQSVGFLVTAKPLLAAFFQRLSRSWPYCFRISFAAMPVLQRNAFNPFSRACAHSNVLGSVVAILLSERTFTPSRSSSATVNKLSPSDGDLKCMFTRFSCLVPMHSVTLWSESCISLLGVSFAHEMDGGSCGMTLQEVLTRPSHCRSRPQASSRKTL